MHNLENEAICCNFNFDQNHAHFGVNSFLPDITVVKNSRHLEGLAEEEKGVEKYWKKRNRSRRQYTDISIRRQYWRRMVNWNNRRSRTKI